MRPSCILFGFVCLSAAFLAPPAFADRALIVGIDTYADERLAPSLKGAARADALRMHGLLVGTLGYRDEEIRVLLDGKATGASIRGGLETWLPQAKPGERVFFYYAGQGYFADVGGRRHDLILPSDAGIVSSGGRPSVNNALDERDIDAGLAGITGRQVTEIIDSSHSDEVTRAIHVEASTGNPAARSPRLNASTRAIAVEPQLGMDSPPPPAGSLVKWEAVSPAQIALVDEGAAPAYRGLFTSAFADGLEKGLADANHNGAISNQELLDYTRAQSAAYCREHADRCGMGLTPMLSGEEAALKLALGPAGAAGKLNQGKPTADKILDLMGARPARDIRVEQIPPSPVKLGTRDMHFRVTSPRDGFLILLSVSDDGEVVQLFPNAVAAAHGKDGRIRAGRPITVPDPSYGIRFDATSVTSGTVLALVVVDPLKLSSRFVTRKIDVIPQDEVNDTLLPELAQGLAAPANPGGVEANVKAVGRSVATLRYQIVP